MHMPVEGSLVRLHYLPFLLQMSTLNRFPDYKRALGGKPLCFSVSAAVNYIRQDKIYIERLPRSAVSDGVSNL